MGAFYGSIQIRGDESDAVREVLEDLGRKKNGRSLLGPPLGGWIGVYFEGNGQDERFAREIALRLGCELFHLVIHDDDVFIYEYYRDGQRIDRYNSCPDYFEKTSPRKRRELAGRPELFAHLAVDSERFESMRIALHSPANDSILGASDLLLSFAASLGMRNVLTSYEYLKDNEEPAEVEGWEQFVHFPDASRERLPEKQEKQSKVALREETERLMREGFLLAAYGGSKGITAPAPIWCPAPDGHGFIVVWSSYLPFPDEARPLEQHGPPWSDGPDTLDLPIGRQILEMAISGCGRFLAVGHTAGERKAVLWDLPAARRVADAEHLEALGWVGFNSDDTAMLSISSSGEVGRIVVTPTSGGTSREIPLPYARLAAVHPSGVLIAVADALNRLVVVNLDSTRSERTLFVGGRQDLGGLMSLLTTQARSVAATVNFDKIEQQVRKQQAELVRRFTQAGLPAQLGSSEQIVDQVDDQVSALVRRMHDSLAQPGIPEERGAEVVFRLAFDRSGERLFLATSAGVRVYRWAEISQASVDMPRPEFAVDGAPPARAAAAGIPAGAYVYDLAYDHGREWLIFGGVEGLVRYIDLKSGQNGTILSPPGRPPILRLGLSHDCSSLAVSVHPDMLSQSKNRHGPSVQFWDYARLCESA